MTEQEQIDRIHTSLGDLRDKITRIDTMQEAGGIGHNLLVAQITKLTEAVQLLTLKINTIETQRNTALAAASLMGSVVTLVAHWVYRLMTGTK